MRILATCIIHGGMGFRRAVPRPVPRLRLRRAVYAAIGSDSLGSCRIPASYCGVYALKPTPGEISTHGMRPAARRLDSVGLLARGVDDLGVALRVLAGIRRTRSTLAPAPCRHGVAGLGTGQVFALACSATCRAGVSKPDVATLFSNALQTLQHELPNRRSVDFDDFPVDQARRAAFFLIEAEMRVTYAGCAGRSEIPLVATPAKVSRLRATKTAADYVVADRMLDAAVEKARRLFAQVDVLVTPTTPQAAFAHGGQVPANQADFTCFANLAGCPALSLPMGISSQGLPVGMQLLGPPGADLRLLELGEVCAAALDATPTYPIQPAD